MNAQITVSTMAESCCTAVLTDQKQSRSAHFLKMSSTNAMVMAVVAQLDCNHWIAR
jgi:hypothetical protein